MTISTVVGRCLYCLTPLTAEGCCPLSPSECQRRYLRMLKKALWSVCLTLVDNAKDAEVVRATELRHAAEELEGEDV